MTQKDLERDFSRKTIKALAKKGIRIYDKTWLPKSNDPMPMANGETGYKLDDNGTSRIMNWASVEMLAQDIIGQGWENGRLVK